MKHTFKALLPSLFIVAFMFSGCKAPQGKTINNEKNNVTKETTQTDQGVDYEKAVAIIHSNDGTINATITFTKVEEGVKVQGEFSGLTEGMHAYHVHEYGDCRADDYSSAGPHLVFDPPAPKDAPIVGNIGEFSANANGVAKTETIIKNVDFANLIGRAVVIHDHGNNLNPPPTGNAGPRIACGSIGYANPSFSSGM